MQANKKERSDSGQNVGKPTVAATDWHRQALQRFRLIFRAVQRHSMWVETNCGVSSAQLWILWEVSNRPGLRVTDLAETMSIHQSTASNLLEKLVRKGLVKRERIHRDQRIVSLTLTEAGVETLRQVSSPARGILQHALFSLPEEVLRSLTGNLDALIDAMGTLDEDEQAAMQPINTSLKIRKPKKQPLGGGG